MAPNLPLGAARGVLAALRPGRLLAAVAAQLPARSPPTARLPAPSLLSQHQRPSPFSTTAAAPAPPPVRRSGQPGSVPAQQKGGKKGGSSRRKRLAGVDPKIRVLDRALYKTKFVAPPLRMGRNRFLRHWTIHRAWLLFRRQAREARERELMQQYQSMRNACEALRQSRGPGLQDEGYLFRVAMEKKGVWRHGGVPVEYARPQTDTPGHVPWNHDWQP